MKISRRGKTFTFRFDKTDKDQELARQLLSAMSGKEVEPWKAKPEPKAKAQIPKPKAQSPKPDDT